MTVDYGWLDPKNKQSGTTTSKPKPTPTPVASPTPSPTPTTRPTPSPTPSPTQTQRPAPTPSPSPRPTQTAKPPSAPRPAPGLSLDDPRYDPDPKPTSITGSPSGSSGSRSSDYYVPWPSSKPPQYVGSGLVQPQPERWSVQRADSAWFDLSPSDQNRITGIARSMGRRSGKALWDDVVRASAYSSVTDNPRSPFDYLNDLDAQYAAGEGPAGGRAGGRGGRGGGYSGPVQSVVKAAETDIIASAQIAAQELLGRAPTDEEIEKILRRTRKAEMAQPQVTRREGPGMTITEEGLTKEGRDAILNQVLMKSPDYAGYQIDSTMMDMFSNILRRGQEVARG